MEARNWEGQGPILAVVLQERERERERERENSG
jgi:hypothetical protein